VLHSLVGFPIQEPEQFNWKTILQRDAKDWQSSIAKSKNGPSILIATSTGGHPAITPIESMLGVALTLRGVRVHFLLCDQVLPACLQVISTTFSDKSEFINNGPSNTLCPSCYQAGKSIYKQLGLPIHLYSKLVTEAEHEYSGQISESIALNLIPDYQMEDIAVGEHAIAGAIRYFAREDLASEPNGELVLRRYFKASLITTYAIRRLLNRFNFDCAVFHHGIYVPQGLIGEVARHVGLPVVNWNPAYRKRCFIFSHNDTYHHTLMSEPIDNWEGLVWSTEMESQLMEYLKSRWQGSQDWIWFHEKPQIDISGIIDEIGVDFSKPCIGMLTNVIWDAQLHYPENVFHNMVEWLIETIKYFSDRQDLQLLIRVHPAEIRGTVPSRQKVVEEIEKAFSVLPANVFIVSPESKVSTYVVMMQCNAVIIYGTKTGVELTSMGIPVIVGGEAWIRGKGFTKDAHSVDEYFRILDNLPLNERLSESLTNRARKYAYHFFFRRMIPLSFMEPTGKWPPYRLQIQSLDNLLPNCNPGLDVICDGILNGTEFIYPFESLPPNDAQNS